MRKEAGGANNFAVPTVDAFSSGITKELYVGPDGLPHFEVTTRDKSGKPILDATIPVVASVLSADGTGLTPSPVLPHLLLYSSLDEY